jgi:uncharacterized protein (DUF433 family)
VTSLLAFTPDQVSRVTGLSRRQLAYWEQTGFFAPAYIDSSRPRFGRMYSFKDVVGLKTVARLRDRLPLQELRRIGAWLHERYDEPWNALTFYVAGQSVVFEAPSGDRRVAGSGQMVLPIHLAEVERDVTNATDELRRRDSRQVGRIVRNRFVQHNTWVIDGTRIPTRAIWEFAEAGCTAEEIRAEYPGLEPDDISAAIDFERRARAKAG